MESSSLLAAGEDPNVCIRFWLGPTNLGILRPHLDVMKEHPVIIEQRDFRFDIYGRPADVANAIAYSFLRPTSNTDDTAQEGTTAADTSPGYRQPSSFSLPSGKDEQESDIIAALGRLGGQRSQRGDTGAKSGYQPNRVNPPTLSLSKPTSPLAATTDTIAQRSFTVDPIDRKTDYDLAFAHFYGTLNDKEQATAETQELKPWSVSILLSMPFRVVQYLMLMSHGFKTYLVEEPNLDACGRQGISQERLSIIAKPAGLVVAINNIQLPRLDSNPEESPVWLQIDDRKALRAVLLGVGKALAQEPVRGVIQKGLGEEEVALRKSWDSILGQAKTSGTTPSESEWVTDTREAQQNSTHSTDSAPWNEPSIEGGQWDMNTPTQRRSTPERMRHPLRRISSHSRVSENRRRQERGESNTRLTAEWDRYDSAAEVDRARWDTRDLWTTTTSQSVGNFFTESESHGLEASTSGPRLRTHNNNSGLSEDSQGSGLSSRSTSSQDVHRIAARNARRLDDNEDPRAMEPLDP
ncbi:hypothetical protein EC991_010575 [Linnemannia zychae]|nr:hypothetical protein EC991_010575 [Linnemannia zychae]